MYLDSGDEDEGEEMDEPGSDDVAFIDDGSGSSGEGPASGPQIRDYWNSPFLARKGDKNVKISIDISSLCITPATFACKHPASAGCTCQAQFARGNAVRLHTYSNARSSRLAPSHPHCFGAYLSAVSLESVVPSNAVAEADLTAASTAARAHICGLTGAPGLGEDIGGDLAHFRDNLASAYAAHIGAAAFAAWLEKTGTDAANAGKQLTMALSGMFSPTSHFQDGRPMSQSYPCGPLSDLCGFPAGLAWCTRWYLSVCHLMMWSVYGAVEAGGWYSYKASPIEALVAVYDRIIAAHPQADPELTISDAIDTLQDYNADAMDRSPFDLTAGTHDEWGEVVTEAQPGPRYADVFIIVIPPKYCATARSQTSYCSRFSQFLKRHPSAMPDAVMEAAQAFHEWYEARFIPAEAAVDGLGILQGVSSAEASSRHKVKQLRQKAKDAPTDAVRAALEKEAKRAGTRDPLARAIVNAGYEHFEVPIVKRLFDYIGANLDVRMAGIHYDAVRCIPATAAVSRSFCRVVRDLDLSDMSPYATVHATCKAIPGEVDFFNSESRPQKRRRATDTEESPAEEQQQMQEDIKKLAVEYAQLNGLIRISCGHEPGKAMVHFRVPGFASVYTPLARCRGGDVVGQSVGADDFFGMVLSAKGANGSRPRQDLWDKWQLDAPGLGKRQKVQLRGWLEETHHVDFPVERFADRQTFIAMRASAEDEAATGAKTCLVSMLELVAVGREIAAVCGLGNTAVADAMLHAARPRYYFPDNGPQPVSQDRSDGGPPIITRTDHCLKRMPSVLSMDLRKLDVFGVMYPHMFHFKDRDGETAKHLRDAVNITEYQWHTMVHTTGIFGMGCVPGVRSPQLLVVASGPADVGKSLVGSLIANFNGPSETCALQQTASAGNQFVLADIDQRTYFKWFLLMDDMSTSLSNMLSDYKQVITRGMFSLQRKNAHQKTVNTYDPAKVTNSGQDYNSAAGLLYMSTNDPIAVFGTGVIELGLPRRVLWLRYYPDRRPAIDPTLEDKIRGLNGRSAIGEIMVAVVASGMVGYLGDSQKKRVAAIVPNPDHPDKLSYIEEGQEAFASTLQQTKYEGYDDFISETMTYTPSATPWEDGAVVDFTPIFHAAQVDFKGADRANLKAAILYHFKESNVAGGQRVGLEKKVMCCKATGWLTGVRHKVTDHDRFDDCQETGRQKVACVVLNIAFVAPVN